jgi:hypothetical protein
VKLEIVLRLVANLFVAIAALGTAVQWPSSSQPSSENTWRFGRVSVRYRLIPDAQTVEVLAVSGPHIDAGAI